MALLLKGQREWIKWYDVGNVSSVLWKLPFLAKDYSSRDIYYCDRTGLFFWALPNKTLTSKNVRCTGGELSKRE